MDTKNSTTTNEELFDEQQYLWDVLDSDLDPIEKIKKIADNHQLSSSDIIAELLQLAPYPENYFEQSKPVCANGEPFCDYIASNRLRFDTLNRYIKELKKDGEYEALCKANKKFFIDVDTAIALFMLYDYIDTLDSTEDVNSPKIIKEFYVTSLKIIDICTDYLEAARIKYGNDLVYYNVGQRSLMKKRFIKEESEEKAEEPTEAPQSAPEHVEAPAASEPAKAENTQSNAKIKVKKPIYQQPSAPFIWLLACLGAAILSAVLTIATMNAVISIVWLVISVAMLVIGCFFQNRIYHFERYVCPECGGKRTLSKEFMETTENSRTYERNTNKSAGSDVKRRTSFTHWFRNTYTCTECGFESVKKESEDGGAITFYYDGRYENTLISYRNYLK